MSFVFQAYSIIRYEFSGDINTVRLLITLGAEVNQPSLAGQTPLQLAVLAGDVALVDLLLEKGADMKVCLVALCLSMLKVVIGQARVR